MPEKKIIAVVGATGAQGGGLVRAIMNGENKDFTARALTRNVNSDKAKELAKLGAEVVAADVDNLESLKKAFQGADGAFCVTFFWEHFSPEKEFERRSMASNTSSGPPSKIPASGSRSAIAACQPLWASTRCRTSMPRAMPIRCSPNLPCRRRSC